MSCFWSLKKVLKSKVITNFKRIDLSHQKFCLFFCLPVNKEFVKKAHKRKQSLFLACFTFSKRIFKPKIIRDFRSFDLSHQNFQYLLTFTCKQGISDNVNKKKQRKTSLVFGFCKNLKSKLSISS